MSSLELLISPDNEVRVIDAFVEALDPSRLGFRHTLAAEGHPPFHPKTFLKLYLYGYMNRVRSSRRLEKECERNTEVKWLLGNLVPNYHSIADFRKEYGKQFKAVFKLLVLFLRDENLLGKTTVGIDGSKFRAVNSKKKNYNEKKIKRHLEYIENKAGEYMKELERMDAEEDNNKDKFIRKHDIKKKLRQLKERKFNYEEIQKRIEQSDDGQVSTTDAESKALIINKNIVEVSYNAQTAVDDKNNLIVHYEATNRNDAKALHKAATSAKEILQVETLTVLADKGYHNGEQLEKCEKDGITTVVANREQPSVKHLEEKYLVENFQYNKEDDTYICPQGHAMKTNGNWYKKNHWSEKRKTICEHPFGTIKRAWGYTHTLLKGLKKVDGEMGLIFTIYNLKRVINILSTEKLIAKLKKWKPDYKLVCKRAGNPLFLKKTTSLTRITALQNFSYRLAA